MLRGNTKTNPPREKERVMSSHRLKNFVFGSAVAVAAAVSACGSSVNDATPSCTGEGAYQVGDKCKHRPPAKAEACQVDADCADIDQCLADPTCHEGKCYYEDVCNDDTASSSTAASSTSTGTEECVPEANADGSMSVELEIGGLSPTQADYAAVNNDWDGSGWDQTVFSGDQTILFQAMMKSGVHILNVDFGDGTYLVEGLPQVYLRVPESAVLARFGGCVWTEIALLASNGAIAPHEIRYGWRSSDGGANVIACNSDDWCTVAVHP